MAMSVSKTQIDKLGERLKKGDISQDDLRLLDAYRRSFADASDAVLRIIRKDLKLEPTERLAKSTTSISEKLRRESIRLTQIQDIAGCRLIVPDMANQDRVVQSLQTVFESTSTVDRRQKPSHGYRAVHVIVSHLGKMVEIQVRTELQHLWAEFSEKAADLVGSEFKYGGGDKELQKVFQDLSSILAQAEILDAEITEEISQEFWTETTLTNEEKQEIAALQTQLVSAKQELFKEFRDTIQQLKSMKGNQ